MNYKVGDIITIISPEDDDIHGADASAGGTIVSIASEHASLLAYDVTYKTNQGKTWGVRKGNFRVVQDSKAIIKEYFEKQPLKLL